MLGFFCYPYPEETLYSAYARYAKLVAYPSRLKLTQELTGSRNPVQIGQLSGRLQHLVDALPPGFKLSVDFLINHHTLLPIYEKFWRARRAIRVRDAMASAGGIKIESAAGLHATHIPLPRWFRFCPVCVNQDKDLYGECYWRRLHQMTGVEVCPTHAVFLEESRVPTRHCGRWAAFITAEDAITQSTPRSCGDHVRMHQILLQLAQDMEVCLN